MTTTPWQQGYYDGYADLSVKYDWYDSAEEQSQYFLGEQAGMLDALLEVQRHNERHTHA